jgi:uncharacterized membrane protein YeaQ/YmgE (transglycosylase-associated protein family)
MTTSQTTARPSKPLYANFGFQVLVALVIGVILGLIARSIGPVDGGPNWLAQTLSTVGSAAGVIFISTWVVDRNADRAWSADLEALINRVAARGAEPLNHNHFKIPLMENLAIRAIRSLA